jgi:RNA polymerase sigma factor (sigma-70 family)
VRGRDEQEAVSQPQGLGSFDELYSAYFRSLYRYVARRVGPDHAEELTAEVFAQAWIRRDRFDPSLGSPSTWLFAIATNLVRRHRRTEERKLRALARWHQPAFVPSGEREVLEGVAARDVWPQVAAALLEVGPTDRDCIYLYAVAGLSYAEVATTLSLPIGTVRSRINRVRGKLRRAVQGTLDLQG